MTQTFYTATACRCFDVCRNRVNVCCMNSVSSDIFQLTFGSFYMAKKTKTSTFSLTQQQSIKERQTNNNTENCIKWSLFCFSLLRIITQARALTHTHTHRWEKEREDSQKSRQIIYFCFLTTSYNWNLGR